MHACPRCETPCAPHTLGEATFATCADCRGLLFSQPDLVRFLRQVTKEAGVSISPTTEIRAIPDRAGPIGCPACARKMEVFGYMESRLVHLDRCSACRLVWVESEELETVVRLFARTAARADERQAEVDELERHLSALVYATGRGDFPGMGI